MSAIYRRCKASCSSSHFQSRIKRNILNRLEGILDQKNKSKYKTRRRLVPISVEGGGWFCTYFCSSASGPGLAQVPYYKNLSKAGSWGPKAFRWRQKKSRRAQLSPPRLRGDGTCAAPLLPTRARERKLCTSRLLLLSSEERPTAPGMRLSMTPSTGSRKASFFTPHFRSGFQRGILAYSALVHLQCRYHYQHTRFKVVVTASYASTRAYSAVTVTAFNGFA